MLPKEEILYNRAKTVTRNSAEWTEHSGNTKNTNIRTTALFVKMFMCRMSFVNI